MKKIISRYNEDISWCENLTNCIIYNKGNDDLNTKHTVYKLNNVGREAHTYLYYIINNYDNLDDYTVFLQGFPFDHCPSLIVNLNVLEYNLKEYENIIFKNNTNNNNFIFIAKYIFNKNINRDETHIGLPLIDHYQYIFKKNETNKPFTFGAGAQFIVSKESILSRSKEFYERMMSLVDNEICPIGAYTLERFWHMIFTHSE